MMYSASSYSGLMKFGDSAYYLKNQMRATAIGIVAMVICAMMDYRIWQKYAMQLFGIMCVVMFLVKTPLGIEANGATRWIGVGSLSVQPSEAMKVAVILVVAHMISQYGPKIMDWQILVKILGFALVGAGLVALLTSNLSTAIIIGMIAVVMTFVATPKYKIFFAIGLGAVGAVAAFIFGGAAFRLSRIQVWLEPEAYSIEGGYQVLQGLYAIGSGGVFGKGLGQSVQKLGYIPEAQNDYVFTIICEELGLVGAIAVVFMFIFLVRRMVVIASNAPDLFGSMVVIGVMAHISVQVILNVAVVTNSIPNTGVTLPFISYGGTSVLFLMAEMGMVLSVSRAIKRYR